MVFDVERAMRLQKLLSTKVLRELESSPPLNLSEVRYVGGFDSSYDSERQYAVAVVYDRVLSRVVDRAHEVVEVKVPYIPGLLAFREVPGYVRAYHKLRVKPEVILVDGHGLAHPRAFGIATHLGLVLNKPSIGVAKRKLYGEVFGEGPRKLIKAHGLVVGAVIEHENAELYVSIGYRVRLEDAIKLVESLLVSGKKLPIPLHEADAYSKKLKKH
ncbi:MAG: endonuclease V [Desulfurococcaceae archaeon]